MNTGAGEILPQLETLLENSADQAYIKNRFGFPHRHVNLTAASKVDTSAADMQISTKEQVILKAIEYTTHLQENGVLLLPPKVLKKMQLKKHAKIKILLLYDEENEVKDLSRFCGKWQDERSANEIVKEIYEDREKNIRSQYSPG